MTTWFSCLQSRTSHIHIISLDGRSKPPVIIENSDEAAKIC